MRFIEALEPIYRSLPSIAPPKEQLNIKTKLVWTGLVLVLFYIMGRIQLIGIESASADRLAGLQVLLASEIGTIITTGIGPIVLASIILQLLVGGKFINLNLTDPADRKRFQGLQKFLAVILCFVEAAIYGMAPGLITPLPGMLGLVILQMTIGSILLIYLDEIVSKYGVGSGISLFIAAGVGAAFFWQVFMPPAISLVQPQGGLISRFIENLGSGANFLLLFPVFMAIAIFLIIVYAEGMHVNIPITMGKTGFGARYPVKLLYVSNMPVILAVALFANVRIWALVTQKIPIVGSFFAGVEWITTAPYNLVSDVILKMSSEGILNGLMIAAPSIGQGLLYVLVLVVTCVVFGKFWVQLGGQSTADVARQLEASGMYIPGFRRDERIIKKILERYIPAITILGSVFVGLLAGFGDMVLGSVASGTGILLTVGIVYRLYEEIARDQVFEQHALLSKIMGAGK